MDDPNITGSITEAMLIASLIKEHKTVLKPFNPSCRYDLAVEENGTFYRIQCKTGRLKNGVVVFPTANTVGKLSNSRRTYEGDVDYFGVYCPETNTCYLVPIEFCGRSLMHLRVAEAKNGQLKNINQASDFLISDTSFSTVTL